MSSVAAVRLEDASPPSPDRAPGRFRFLPVARLRSSYAALRPSGSRVRRLELSDLPIRVAPAADGSFEVIDGFQRLERWRSAGHTEVPAVIERPGRPTAHKRLLLLANAPPRTVTALDEARVAVSLRRDEGLGVQAIARLLGHRREWVTARLRIGTRLSKTAEQKLAERAIGPSLAHALCACAPDAQDELLGAIAGHGLGAREALALSSCATRSPGSARRADRPESGHRRRGLCQEVWSRATPSAG